MRPTHAPATEQRDDRLFTSAFVIAVVANFVNSAGHQITSTILPVYVVASGGTQAEAGLVNGFLAFTSMFVRPFVGWLADAWKRRPLVLIGTSGYAAASLIYTLTGTLPGVLIGRIVHGFGLSSYSTASSAFVADIAPVRRRAEAMGMFSMSQALGLILGPALGFALIPAIGIRNIFLLTAALAAGAFVISLFPKEQRQPPAERPPWTFRTGLVSVEALPTAWMAVCLGLGFGPINAFIALYAQQRGIENPGLFFTMQAIALLLSRTFSGRLADTHGRAVVIAPGIVVTAAALFLLPFATDLPHFLFAAALFGLGFGSCQPATSALVVDSVPTAKRGLAMSTYMLGFDLGIALGAIGLGNVGQQLGFDVLWTAAGTCVLMALLGLVFAMRVAKAQAAAAE